MAIPSRQIGWGTEENLLWQISKQLETLTRVVYNIGGNTTSTTSTTTTVAPSYLYYVGSPCLGGANVIIRSTISLTPGTVVYHSNLNCCTITGLNPGLIYDADYVSTATCFVAPCP
jgi:hypothetical protein